jgi:predicted short-subunit dehydrogenase-like oxidoreductase (DUF2520 family)
MRELERNPTHISEPAQALPPIVVIGRGRVGGSVASAAAVLGLDVRQVGREDLDAGCAEAEVALLCVPDGEIAAAAERVAAHAPRLRFVGHTSGATGLGALAAAADAGALTFSLHPLQTVPDDRASLAGAPAAIAGGDEVAVELARALAEALAMVPFEVAEDTRAAYHAAACIASNFLVALEESAAGLLEAAGVGDGAEARQLLAPLVLRTAANWAERGGNALTGPIARGDTETVRGHLEALRAHAPELLPLYEALAGRTMELAATRAQAAAPLPSTPIGEEDS